MQQLRKLFPVPWRRNDRRRRRRRKKCRRRHSKEEIGEYEKEEHKQKGEYLKWQTTNKANRKRSKLSKKQNDRLGKKTGITKGNVKVVRGGEIVEVLTKLWGRESRQRERKNKRKKRREKKKRRPKTHTVHVLNQAFHSHRQETTHLNTRGLINKAGWYIITCIKAAGKLTWSTHSISQ